MPEFFVVANSNAAPIVSDTSHQFVMAETAEAALDYVVANYGHPAGLYAARVWTSADAFHKDEPWLAQWLSQRAYATWERG